MKRTIVGILFGAVLGFMLGWFVMDVIDEVYRLTSEGNPVDTLMA
jgi:hypothetical protein